MSNVAEETRCKCLKSKSSYGAFGEYLEEVESIAGASTTFWCLRTMSKAGPDDHYVHASICRRGRSCWESPSE